MTNITPDIAPTDTIEGMPRRDFIRKSLVASGGVFVGMAMGEKMALPGTLLSQPWFQLIRRQRRRNFI